MGLSIIKAALIIAYFMHMKFEITPMRWMTMASLVFCLGDDDGVFAGRIPYSSSGRKFGGEMKWRLATLTLIPAAVGWVGLRPGLRHVLQQRAGRDQRRPAGHQPGRAGVADSPGRIHDPGVRHGDALQQEDGTRTTVRTMARATARRSDFGPERRRL